MKQNKKQEDYFWFTDQTKYTHLRKPSKEVSKVVNGIVKKMKKYFNESETNCTIR